MNLDTFETLINTKLPQLEQPQSYSLELYQLIEQYNFLLDISVIDFFTLDGFNNLPIEWQQILTRHDNNPKILEKCGDTIYHIKFIHDLVQAAGNGVVQESWPTSLKKFFIDAYRLPLQNFYTASNPKKKVATPKIDNRFQIRMSPKKQHEVGIMSNLVGLYGKAHGASSVVDLGSGQGYLDRLIAYQHGLDVLGVDGDPDQTTGAIKIDSMFAKRAGNSLKVTPGKLNHTTLRITEETLGALNTEVSRFISNDWVLCGLHTCGPLAYTMLDLFKNSNAKCLVTVACCYNRLEGGDDFPRSQFLQSSKLGRLAYKMACQTPSTWPTTLENCFEFFKRHFFRALLQKFMVINDWLNVNEDLPTVGKLHKSCYCDFATYASKALELFEKPIPDRSVLVEFHDDNFRGFPQIALVWALQSALAPSIESLLIMDRFLSLEESLGNNENVSSGKVNIIPLFDLLVSPRCFAITAHR